MYRSAADALLGLLDGGSEGSSCTITSMSRDIVRMRNGIKYFAVEVTAEDGAQYGISAFDKEAEDLYEVAMTRSRYSRTGDSTSIPTL